MKDYVVFKNNYMQLLTPGKIFSIDFSLKKNVTKQYIWNEAILRLINCTYAYMYLKLQD